MISDLGRLNSRHWQAIELYIHLMGGKLYLNMSEQIILLSLIMEFLPLGYSLFAVNVVLYGNEITKILADPASCLSHSSMHEFQFGVLEEKSWTS